MPKILIGDSGKVKIGANGKLADKDCCCTRICYQPSLQCDAIGASLSKCGFSPFNYDRCTDPFDNFGYTDAVFFEGGCSAEFFDCATSVGDTVDANAIYLTKTVTQSGSAVPDPPSCNTNCETCGETVSTTTYDPADCSHSTEDTGTPLACCDPCFGCVSSCPPCIDPPGGPPFLSHPVSGSQVLSDEYTTAMLIANTNAAVPTSYPDTWVGECAAGTFVSDDESSCTVNRFKWRIWHYPPSTCYLKVWLRKRSRPDGVENEDGHADTLTDIPLPHSPYVFDRSSPCLNDPNFPALDLANAIFGDATEELNGPRGHTTTIEIKKWSCKRGYEPDDPNNDGTRPDPDLRPDGPP